MRWRMVLAIPWLLAALSAVLLAQTSMAQDDNLLIIGGFEDGTEGWLAIGGELSVSDAFAHGGLYAGVFATDSTSSRREVSYCLPVAQSSEYEFRGYAARREGGGASSPRLIASWYGRTDCFGQELWTIQSSMVPLDDEERWYELALGGRSPDDALSAYLTIDIQESEATVYLDDFAARRAVTPTETPTAEPSASSTPTPRPIPSGSPTPQVSPTASSSYRTPVPVQGTLQNGGFEQADSQDLPSFWRNHGGDLARTSEVRFEGQFAAVLTSDTNSAKWAYQAVTVQGGKAYVLSARALKNDPAVTAAYLRLSWYASPDGSGQAIDSADSTVSLADNSPAFRLLSTGAVVAPVKAASAKVRLMLAPAGQAPGIVYFDAVTFEETELPQPVSSPTATPSVVVSERTARPGPFATTDPPPSAPPVEQAAATTPVGGAAASQASPTAATGVATSTPAVLGAVRTPAIAVAAASAAATAAAHSPPAVYRQRKPDPAVGDEGSMRPESDESGLPVPLLALATGIPALAGVSAGAYYWRWRRARLR